MSYKGSGKKFMDVVTYTGTNVARDIGGLEFSPDFVWIKSRSAADSHYLFDTVRGAGEGLFANSSAAETTYTNLLTSFNDDGFGLGDGNDTNTNNDTYVAWCWNAGDTTEEIAAGAYNDRVFDSREIWSNDVVALGGTFEEPASNIFDGNLSTRCRSAADNGTITITFPAGSFPTVSKVEVYWTQNTGPMSARINGGTYESLVRNEWTDLEVLSPGDGISTLTIKGSPTGKPSFNAVRINGKLLVDTDSGAQSPSVSSTVRVNQDAGFSVVTYAGNGGNTAASVGHGLGSEPKFMMVKNLDSPTNWEVYHHTQPGNLLYLNTSDAVQASGTFDGATEDTFNVADTVVNATGENIVAYVWSEVPGFSKFGDYPGNSLTTFVYTGFTPRWIMVKGTQTGTNWRIHDTKRGINQRLEADGTGIESDEGNVFSALSNGFTVSGTSGGYNASGTQYIYMAFAEQPFGKASKKRLEFSSTQDFKEILNQDVLTQYPSTTASAAVESVDVDNASIEVYTDGLSDNFLPNTNQTFTKPVTDPSNKRWTWTAWVKRSELGTSQKILTTTDSGFNIEFDINNKLVVGGVPFSYYYYVGTPSNLDDVLTNGVPYTGQNIATNQNLVMVRNGSPEIRSGNTFRTAGGFFFGLDASRPGGYYTADGTRLGGAGTYNESNWLDMFYTTRDQEDNYDQSYAIYTNSPVAYILMGNYNGTSAQPGELTPAGLLTTETYTDPGAWMHILVSCDLISGEGYKLYVNGDEVTDFDSQVQPDADIATTVNTTSVEQFIGTDVSGYIADVQFVDGQALTPSDFTYDNTSTREGQLYPLRYSGWYGTRGYRLPMEGQTFETSEITNVVNVLEEANAETGGTWTLIEGTATSYENGNPMNSWSNVFDGNTSTNSFFAYGGVNDQPSRYRYTFPEPIPFVSLQAWCSAYSSAQINLLSFNGGERRQGGSGGTSALVDFTSITPGSKLEYLEIGTDGFNYGLIAQIIIDGVPLGVTYDVNRTLLTLTDATNLSTFSVGDSVIQGGIVSAPTPAFATTLYTGAGTTPQTITTGIDLTGGGLVWTKGLNSDRDHMLGGPELGVELALSTNLTVGEGTPSDGNYRSFDVDGYTTGASSHLNNDETNYVSWTFRKAPTFFDVVTYTGNGTAGRTVAHNLGSVPGMTIIKKTNATGNWAVYHRNLGNSTALYLHTTGASFSSPLFNNTTPTSTEFTLNDGGDVNGNGNTYIAYLFADTPGLIKCGGYTGAAVPNTIDVGFKPGWLMIKASSSTGNWIIFDRPRDDSYIKANSSDPESAPYSGFEWTDSGFNLTDQSGASNGPSETYIYVAIAEDAMASSEVTPEGILQSINPSVPSLSVSSVLSGWSAGETVEVTGKYITDLHDQNQFTWTKDNINSTDGMVDTPNNYGEENGLGGEVRGNYATLNPLDTSPNTTSTSNGNLEFTASNDYTAIRATQYITEKTYWETEVPTGGTFGTTYYLTGMVPSGVTLVSDGGSRIGFSAVYGKSVSVYPANLNMWYNATTSVSIDTISPGDVIGHTYDPTTGEYSAYVNGIIIGTLTADSSLQYYPTLMNADASNICKINFGATPFAYPAPVGYNTLNTTNAGDPLILQGNTQMDVVTYTGTGAEHTISGLNFSPDLVWIKARYVGTPSVMYDTIRGAGNRLSSSDTTAESYDADSLTGFTSDGFTLGTDLLNGYTNFDGYGEYVAWCWNAGDSTVLNTAGSVASQVRANPLAGFSIVTATLGAGEDVGHGLGVTPSMVFAKTTDQAANWYVQFPGVMSGGETLYLNTTGAIASDATWATPAATSSVLKVNSQNAGVSNPSDWVFYCWSEVPGFSSFGKYTGTGSSDGPFISTGFKPRWIMVKLATGSVDDWFIIDTERSPSNPAMSAISPNNTNTESTATSNSVNITSNGFHPVDSNQNLNGSGYTYIYAAFAEMPTKYLPQ